MLKIIVAAARLVACSFVPAVLGSGQPLAAPSIYNMDHLLAEPHPFADLMVSSPGSSQVRSSRISDNKAYSTILTSPSIYNMDRLLAEPYPFAPQTAWRQKSSAVAKARVSPQTLIAKPLKGPSIYNIDRLLTEPYPFAHQLVSSSVSSEVVKPKLSPTKSLSKQEARLIRKNKHSPDVRDFESEEYQVSPTINDPLETINRVTFAFNDIVNRNLFNPIAKGYNTALPEFVRKVVANFFNNVNSPRVLANDLLQGEFKRGFTTATRILINTTAGIGGLIDVAERLGFVGHMEDFGQTLAVWGVGEGFYLVLPLLGPSNPRDALGQFFVDSYFDPLSYYLDENNLYKIDYGLTGLGGIVTYARFMDQLERMRDTSIDFYGTLRSLYLQRRKSEILNRSKGAPLYIGADIE